MELEKLFVPKEIAELAYDHKFDWECFTFWNSDGDLQITPKENGDDIKYPGDDKFDRYCNYYGGLSNVQNDIELFGAPTYQQLVDWFEEKHNIFIEVRKLNDNKWCYQVYGPLNGDMIHVPGIEIKYEAYNEAFKEASKLIKK